MSDPVLVSIDDHVATFTLNRPGRRNALSSEVMAALIRHLTHARHDRDIRVVVITGAGDRAFCAGADLASFAPNGIVEEHDVRGQMADLFRAAYGLGKPTIAKVRGYALAGGFGVALMCDLVIAADDAVFGTPEIDVGMWPMLITVPMLRSMPPKAALELQMTGRKVPADEAHQLGFVSCVVPADRLDDTVAATASNLADKPAAILRFGRDAFYRVLDQASDDALAFLQSSLALVTKSEDHREGVAAFLEKRAPQWTGR